MGVSGKTFYLTVGAAAMLAVPVFAVPAIARDKVGAVIQDISGGDNLFVFASDNSAGEIGGGAKVFVESMGHRAIGFLGDPEVSPEQRKEEFRKLLSDSFDMKTIGRFSLGRYWRVSTPQQREEYLALFEEMVVDVYSERFSDYRGQNFEVRSFRAEGEKDVLVTSYIVPDGDPEIRVDWRVRFKNGQYKIIDVIVEGVSMSVTQRSDFASVIQRGGGNVQVLLEHLRKDQE